MEDGKCCCNWSFDLLHSDGRMRKLATRLKRCNLRLCSPSYYTNGMQTCATLGSTMLLMRVSKILKSITMVVLYEDLGICPWTTEGRKCVEGIANPTPDGLVLIQVGIVKSPRERGTRNDANAGKRHDGSS